MKLAKRTYLLPHSLVERFEKALPPGSRSAFLDKMIETWLEEQERAELRRLVVAGCSVMAEDNLQLAREWDPATLELWQKFDGEG